MNGGTCSVSLGTNIQCRCPADTSGNQCQFYNGPVNDFQVGSNGQTIGAVVGSIVGALILAVLALAVFGIYRYAKRANPVDPFLDNPIYGTSSINYLPQKTEGIEMGQQGKYSSVIENHTQDTALTATLYTSVDEGECSQKAL
eukprot:Em0001g1118a